MPTLFHRDQGETLLPPTDPRLAVLGTVEKSSEGTLALLRETSPEVVPESQSSAAGSLMSEEDIRALFSDSSSDSSIESDPETPDAARTHPVWNSTPSFSVPLTADYMTGQGRPDWIGINPTLADELQSRGCYIYDEIPGEYTSAYQPHLGLPPPSVWFDAPVLGFVRGNPDFVDWRFTFFVRHTNVEVGLESYMECQPVPPGTPPVYSGPSIFSDDSVIWRPGAYPQWANQQSFRDLRALQEREQPLYLDAWCFEDLQEFFHGSVGESSEFSSSQSPE